MTVDRGWPTASTHTETVRLHVRTLTVVAFVSPWAREDFAADFIFLITLCFQAVTWQNVTFFGIHLGRQSRRAFRCLTPSRVNVTPAYECLRRQRQVEVASTIRILS